MNIKEKCKPLFDQLIGMVDPERQIEAMELIDNDTTLNEEIQTGGDGKDYKQMYLDLLSKYRSKWLEGKPTNEPQPPNGDMEEQKEPEEPKEEEQTTLEDLGY